MPMLCADIIGNNESKFSQTPKQLSTALDIAWVVCFMIGMSWKQKNATSARLKKILIALQKTNLKKTESLQSAKSAIESGILTTKSEEEKSPKNGIKKTRFNKERKTKRDTIKTKKETAQRTDRGIKKTNNM